LISAKEKQLAAVSSLRMTKEKQQDLIKQLEEKEKLLELQVASITQFNNKENTNAYIFYSTRKKRIFVNYIKQLKKTRQIWKISIIYVKITKYQLIKTKSC
jgi:uncharacterized protein with gpF-like domain